MDKKGKKELYATLEELRVGGITSDTAMEQILLLFDVMPRFVIAYKNDGFEKELLWETAAKNKVDAVDLFWKTHDVMCEIVSVNEQ